MGIVRYFLVLPVLIIIAAFPVVAYASTQSEIDAACAKATAIGGEIPAYCDTTDQRNDPLTGSQGLLTKITNIVGFTAGLVAVIMVIVGGFRFVLSRGDSAKVVTARQTILYALVGLVVIIVARQIVLFILSTL